MKNDLATPRPWTIEIWKYNNITQDCKSVITNGKDAVCEIYNVDRESYIESRLSYKANADLIINAVNEYDKLKADKLALTEACLQMLEVLKAYNIPSDFTSKWQIAIANAEK